jgi:urease accessory protein
MGMGMGTDLVAMPTDGPASPLSRLRLLQLTSPSLPIGGFTYSQGIEWAVERGWLTDREQVADWLQGLIDDGLARLDLPVLARLHRACAVPDPVEAGRWARLLYASRESHELRLEDRQRARALFAPLRDLEPGVTDGWEDALGHCQAGPHALASVAWGIACEDCLLGYAWGWVENQVAAAIKLVPLGQTDGQRLQHRLALGLPGVVDHALSLADDDIGAAAPALAIASAAHETQYTRLFRS